MVWGASIMRRSTTAGKPERRRRAPPLCNRALTRAKTKRLLAELSQEIDELRRYRRSL